MGSLSKRNIRVNADGPGRLLDRRAHLSPATSRNGGICFPSPVTRLNYARVAFAVEIHREGTVVRGFFSTEGVQSQRISVRSWLQVSNQQSPEDAFRVVFPEAMQALFRTVAGSDVHNFNDHVDRSQVCAV
jgi:hypothetical protein